MANTIAFAPYSTTNAQHSFLLQTDGYVAGTFLDNPNTRYALEGGVVASGQSTPLYGGLPITLDVAAPGSGGASSGLGQSAALATAESNVDGFCLFNQASAGVISPSSPVPLYPASTSINFARLGSGLYVVLPVKPADVNTIAGGAANQAIYWDYTNNYVTVTSGGGGALGFQIIGLNTNSKTVSYNSGTGEATWNEGGSVIIVRI